MTDKLYNIHVDPAPDYSDDEDIEADGAPPSGKRNSKRDSGNYAAKRDSGALSEDEWAKIVASAGLFD